jgi:hypothetical protein
LISVPDSRLLLSFLLAIAITVSTGATKTRTGAPDSMKTPEWWTMSQITDSWLITKSCDPYFCTTFCLVCRFWRRYKRKGLGGELVQFWKLLYRHSTSFPGDWWKCWFSFLV